MSLNNQTQTAYLPLRDEFKCPIGHNIIKDPVVAGDGHIYDRTNIYNWFIQSNSTRSPMTNLDMFTTTVFPVIYLQTQIKEWLESIKNKPIPDDVKELVDSYYESLRTPVSDNPAILLAIENMTAEHNNNLTMSADQHDEFPENVELFQQETDQLILDEIDRMITMSQFGYNNDNMFGMFNPSEPNRL